MRNPLTELSVEELRHRRSIKWRQYEPDVLPLWIAEMDTPLAEPIRAALAAAVARGDTGYAHPGRLREAFAAFCARRYGWSPDPAQMIVVPDVVRGLGEVLRVVSAPGDGVVINTPAYPPFFSVITAAGRRLVESPLRRGEDGTYRLDLGALDRDLAADGVTVFVLCNPHNPTGVVLNTEELAAVVEITRRHRVQLLSDEIHAPLTYPSYRHVPVAPLAPEAIVFSSASKAWNLPGLKAALVVAGGDAAWQVLSRLPIEVTFGVALPGVLAGEAAFDEGEEWLAALMRGLDDNRRLLAELLAAKLPGVGYVPPQATYLAWLDLRPLGLGDSPGEVLLERARLALSDGPGFGDAGRGFARLNFATSPSILAEAVDRIASVR